MIVLRRSCEEDGGGKVRHCEEKQEGKDIMETEGGGSQRRACNQCVKCSRDAP